MDVEDIQLFLKNSGVCKGMVKPPAALLIKKAKKSFTMCFLVAISMTHTLSTLLKVPIIVQCCSLAFMVIAATDE